MRVRPQSPTGDYTIGLPFLTNTAAAVAQAILTKLKLWQGEWFVDVTEGTPLRGSGGVLGPAATASPDSAITTRILATPGVKALLSYSGQWAQGKSATRSYQISALVQTIYSTTPVQISTSLTPGLAT